MQLKAPARSAAAARCGPQSLRSLRSLLRLALRKTLRVFRVLVRSAHENAERTAPFDPALWFGCVSVIARPARRCRPPLARTLWTPAPSALSVLAHARTRNRLACWALAPGGSVARGWLFPSLRRAARAQGRSRRRERR